MYSFPKLSDLPNFVGDEIAQIWLDPWAIRFLFSSGAQIYVEEGYEHTTSDGKVWGNDCNAGDGPPILIQRLLYKKIIDLKRSDLRLTLAMADGSELAILTQQGPFDSGHIRFSDGRIVGF